MIPSGNDVVRKLVILSQQLDAAQSEAAELGDAAVRAEGRAKVGFAKAFLSGDGSMEVRKHAALLATAEQQLDAAIANEKARAARERISVLRSQVEIARSIGAAQRAEFDAG